MATGRIDAPDYKADFDAAMSEGRRIADAVIRSSRANAERERLRDAVVEKAKDFGVAWRTLLEWRLVQGGSFNEREALNGVVTECRIQICDAVMALLEFESLQEKKD